MFITGKGLVNLVLISAASAAPRAADDRNMIYDGVHSNAFTFVNVISVIMCLVSATGGLGPQQLWECMSQLPKKTSVLRTVKIS